MNGEAARFSVLPGGQPSRGGEPPSRQLHELWFSISRQPWASLVLVPADEGFSVGWVATALADVGTRLRDTPVTAIVAESVDYASVRALSDIQPRLRELRPPASAIEVSAATPAPEAAPGASPQAIPLAPLGRAIIAVPSVVSEPVALAIAHAADAVLICVELGRSRAERTRRTARLVGADRVLGAVAIR